VLLAISLEVLGKRGRPFDFREMDAADLAKWFPSPHREGEADRYFYGTS
jgi:hypothetical protein